ncbi:MAG: drug/metabolite transporter (DMT)-like permease [Parasphingorhabdus sp.]|jgi:drug/metabolite transporter (DMT)-like permease
MSIIRQPTSSDIGKLILLGAIWASAFLCIEIALRSFAPLVIASWRILIATLVLLPVILIRRETWPRGSKNWMLIFLAGFFYNAVPFSLISWGQQHISSGMAALLMSCGPFIALALSHWLTGDEKFSWIKLVSVVLGFSGVLVLIGVQVLEGTGSAILGQLAMVAAVSCYIFSGLMIRRIQSGSALMLSATILGSSCFYMIPGIWLFTDPFPVHVPIEPWLALLFLGLVPTAFAYIIRVQLLQQVGSNFLALVSYLIPIFGLLWSWLFLDQIPDSSIWLALLLIFAGLAVTRLQPRQ